MDIYRPIIKLIIIDFTSYIYICINLTRVCLWTAVMLCVLAILNACTLITRFTRVAGELFGMLISVLFMQEAVRVCIYTYAFSNSF